MPCHTDAQRPAFNVSRLRKFVILLNYIIFIEINK